MSITTNPACKTPDQCQDELIKETAAAFASCEGHAAGKWEEAFATIIERGYVSGPLVENPHTLKLSEIEVCAAPTVYLQLESFVRKSGQKVVFDYPELGVITAHAVRMADNLVEGFDRAKPGISQQRKIIVTGRGLKSALTQMGFEPQEHIAWKTASRIMSELKFSAYRASVALAAEKGAYPAFDYNAVSHTPDFRLLPEELQEDIKHFGLRNARLLR